MCPRREVNMESDVCVMSPVAVKSQCTPMQMAFEFVILLCHMSQQAAVYGCWTTCYIQACDTAEIVQVVKYQTTLCI